MESVAGVMHGQLSDAQVSTALQGAHAKANLGSHKLDVGIHEMGSCEALGYSNGFMCWLGNSIVEAVGQEALANATDTQLKAGYAVAQVALIAGVVAAPFVAAGLGGGFIGGAGSAAIIAGAEYQTIWDSIHVISYGTVAAPNLKGTLIQAAYGAAGGVVGHALGAAIGVVAKPVIGRIRGLFGAADDLAPKGGLVDFASSATTGDAMYGAERLAKLGRYLERRGFSLRLDDARLPAEKGGGFIAKSREILLRSDASKSQVWHELSHYLDFKRLGPNAYGRLSYPLGREQNVYDLLRRSRHWDMMSLWDRALLETRIERLGGRIWP